MPKSRVEPSPNFVFDDDTSDSGSDEDLKTFHNKVSSIKYKSTSKTIGDNDAGSEDDDTSSGEEESGEDDDDSSEETEESDLTEENKIKLLKLQQQLHKIGESEEQDNESEDDEQSSSDDQDVKDCSGKNVRLNAEKGHSDDDCLDYDEGDEQEDTHCARGEVGITAETNDHTGAVVKRKHEESVDVEKPSGEEKARKKFRGQLSSMSIEDIQKLRERLGLKLFNQKMSGTAPEKGRNVKFKRDNKNRPREMSSKKTVGRFREVVQVAKVERRDPRFDPLCGEFDDKLFKESYQFVNEIKSKELTELKKQIRAEEDPERRKTIKYLIQRMENQLRAEAQNQVKKAQEEVDNKSKKEQLKAGEKPFYMSKSKKNEAKLVEQFEHLKEKGGLDTFIKKKVKKNLSKERKKGLGVSS